MSKEIKCMKAEDYLAMVYQTDDIGTWETISLNGKLPKYVYISDKEECPYLGLGFSDGTYGILGYRYDGQVTLDELFWYLDQT